MFFEGTIHSKGHLGFDNKLTRSPLFGFSCKTWQLPRILSRESLTQLGFWDLEFRVNLLNFNYITREIIIIIIICITTKGMCNTVSSILPLFHLNTFVDYVISLSSLPSLFPSFTHHAPLSLFMSLKFHCLCLYLVWLIIYQISFFLEQWNKFLK